MIQKEKTSNIYIQLANKYNIPHQVVEVICNHPFKFAQNTISDEKDIKPIMFSYLFKIKLKKKYVCKERTKKSNSNVS